MRTQEHGEERTTDLLLRFILVYKGYWKLREAPARDRFLIPGEIEGLLATADTIKPIIIVALHTGMRHGEIISLHTSGMPI